MKIYGIKTCGNVRKALKFFKENHIDYEFIDFKIKNVKQDKIESWLEKVSIDILFNSKGTKYKTLKLKELNLDENDKIQWLAKENMLIKRPVIELKDKVVVAFDGENYKNIFL